MRYWPRAVGDGGSGLFYQDRAGHFDGDTRQNRAGIHSDDAGDGSSSGLPARHAPDGSQNDENSVDSAHTLSLVRVLPATAQILWCEVPKVNVLTSTLLIARGIAAVNAQSGS